MSVQASIPQRTDGRRYEAVLRLSVALSLCQEPEDLTKILSEQLREFLVFLQFYIVVYKENSTEVEWAVVGREKSLVSAYADVPVEQRPSWQAYTRQEPIYIRDWNTDEGIPIRLKQGIAAQGLDVGPLVFVPLTVSASLKRIHFRRFGVGHLARRRVRNTPVRWLLHTSKQS